ncbi:MAG: ATP-binding protein [Pseudolabrys sp.]|nr:ATP-binding protein [Pseudolabrys sp.]
MQPTRTVSSERLVLRTALPELERLTTWLQHVTRGAGLHDDMAFAVQLCLEEAVANIVMYSGLQEAAPIAIEIAHSGGIITATVMDGAPPFDPTQVPLREKPASLEKTRVGELGIHLIRLYSSEMRYERRGDHNLLTLRFDRAKTPAAWA